MKKILMLVVIVCACMKVCANTIFEEEFYVDGTVRASNSSIDGKVVGSTTTGLTPTVYTWSASGDQDPVISGTGDGYLRLWATGGKLGIATVNFTEFHQYDSLTLVARGADVEGPVMRIGFGSSVTSFASGSGDALYLEIEQATGNVSLVKRENGVSSTIHTLSGVNTALAADDTMALIYDRVQNSLGGYFINSTGTSNEFSTVSLGFTPDLSLVKYEFYDQGSNANFPRLLSTTLTGEPLSPHIRLITITSQ